MTTQNHLNRPFTTETKITLGFSLNGTELSLNSVKFSKFRESEESLKHELGSVFGSALLPVSLWSSGIISVSYIGDLGF